MTTDLSIRNINALDSPTASYGSIIVFDTRAEVTTSKVGPRVLGRPWVNDTKLEFSINAEYIQIKLQKLIF